MPVLISQLLAVYLFYKRHWYNVSQNTSYLIATEISELIRNLNSKKIPKQGNYLNLEYSSVSSKLPDHPQGKYVEELEIFKKLLQEELG
ncbi:MAG: ATPase, partial [Rickettsiaceae bacterium]|nr:ATPase [Rickettsiaceae bacterium]